VAQTAPIHIRVPSHELRVAQAPQDRAERGCVCLFQRASAIQWPQQKSEAPVPFVPVNQVPDLAPWEKMRRNAVAPWEPRCRIVEESYINDGRQDGWRRVAPVAPHEFQLADAFQNFQQIMQRQIRLHLILQARNHSCVEILLSWEKRMQDENELVLESDDQDNWTERQPDDEPSRAVLLEIYNAIPGHKRPLDAWQRQEMLNFIERLIQQHFKRLGAPLGHKWADHPSSLAEFREE
jgi:hypothetical protein